MLITISGLSGSGKTTAAKLLSERLGIPTVDVGALFRAMARNAKMDVCAYGDYAAAHPEVDRKLDRKVLALAKKGDVILQGRLTGLVTHQAGIPAVRIWLEAPVQTRASRVARREHHAYRSELKRIVSRDRVNRDRYAELYGLDLNDKSVYDTVVRTDNRSPERVNARLVKEIPHIWLTKRKTRPKPPRPPRKRPLKRKPRQKRKPR